MFTLTNLIKIRELGYITRTDTPDLFLLSFMSRHFEGFDVYALLLAVEIHFTPCSTAPIRRSLEFNFSERILHISYINEFSAWEEALMFVRKFTHTHQGMEVEHVYCVLPETNRRQGLVRPVLRESLKQYLKMGVKKIKLYAGLEDGGYVWAKCGFRATEKHQVQEILNTAKMKLDAGDYVKVEKIFDGYYSRFPQGKAFPMDLWAVFDFMKFILKKSAWNGELDLNNAEQMDIFVLYVNR